MGIVDCLGNQLYTAMAKFNFTICAQWLINSWIAIPSTTLQHAWLINNLSIIPFLPLIRSPGVLKFGESNRIVRNSTPTPAIWQSLSFHISVYAAVVVATSQRHVWHLLRSDWPNSVWLPRLCGPFQPWWLRWPTALTATTPVAFLLVVVPQQLNRIPPLPHHPPQPNGAGWEMARCKRYVPSVNISFFLLIRPLFSMYSPPLFPPSTLPHLLSQLNALLFMSALLLRLRTFLPLLTSISLALPLPAISSCSSASDVFHLCLSPLRSFPYLLCLPCTPSVTRLPPPPDSHNLQALQFHS